LLLCCSELGSIDIKEAMEDDEEADDKPASFLVKLAKPIRHELLIIS